MLTATYSLVTISAEQKNSRSILSRLQQTLRSSLDKIKGSDLGGIRAALDKLLQFDQYWHLRKMEIVVIPAIRGRTREVDAVLEELECMSAKGMAMLRTAQEHLRGALTQGSLRLQELLRSLEGYCENLWLRLVKEETELLPLLKRSLTSEQWFPIATRFLSDAAHAPRPSQPRLD